MEAQRGKVTCSISHSWKWGTKIVTQAVCDENMSGGKDSGPGKDIRDLGISTLSSVVGPVSITVPGTLWVLKGVPET